MLFTIYRLYKGGRKRMMCFYSVLIKNYIRKQTKTLGIFLLAIYLSSYCYTDLTSDFGYK